jgi:hypothetical protein
VLVPIDLSLSLNKEEVAAYRARLEQQEQAATAAGVKVSLN